MSGSSCPSPPFKQGTTIDNQAKQASTLLNSLNISGCSTFSQGASSYSFLGSGGETGAINSANGCASVGVLLQSYGSTVNAVYCAIQKNTTKYLNSFTNIDTITIKAGGNLTIDCTGTTGFSTFQIANTTVNALNVQNLSDNVTDPVNQAITNGITDWIPAQKAAALADGSDPNKTDAAVSQIRENITTNTFKNESHFSRQSISNIVVNGTNLTMTAGGDITIEGSDCTMNQDSLVIIAIKNTVANAFVGALKGADLGGLFPPPLAPKNTKRGMFFWGALVLVVIIIAVLVYFYVIKKKAKPLAFSFYET
jgi:hypothetical protein